MKLSVVIGTYNQRDVLKKTLEALFHQTLSPEYYEIQLIDSSSTDGTAKMVEELKPTCRFNYRRVDNQGKTFARNLGIKQAVNEIIFLTDADIIADKCLLAEHLNAHKNGRNAAFEGLEIDTDGKPYIKARLRPGQKLKWAYFLSGNLSLRKETIVKAGLFDERFTGYGWEDIELGYRLFKMKIPLLYLPSAINYHHHPVTYTDMLKRKYELGKSAAYFYKKHPNFWIKMFLGMNPLAMGIYHFLKTHPQALKQIKNQYILEEYQYRLGLEEGLNPKPFEATI